MHQFSSVGSLVTRYKLPALVVIAFIAGFALRGGRGGPHTVTAPPAVEHATHETAQVWTCAMHPQIRRPGPGKCPICGMDLIPVREEQSPAEGAATRVRLSPQAVKLAGVQTARVKRMRLEREIRLVGRVAYDETRVKDITARAPGRIDTLHVDFTGAVVRKDEPLASLYSPELLTAQEELIQALRSARELGRSPLSTIRDTAPLTVDAAREKLRLLGLTPQQIADIERKSRPADHVTVASPLGGVVIEKDAIEGMYVETGMKLFRVADLSTVWVKLDIYESDIPWLRNGQEVEFSGDAFPGEMFSGRVVFIDPVLDPMTRTVKVRVEVPNPDGRIKPDMFVRSSVRSGGAAGRPRALPLVIPASAPLVTGKRAVVYVATPGIPGEFEGREVVLGARAGNEWEVMRGLAEGESVVVNGAFRIDSSAQILARPSMMNPEGGAASLGHQHGGAPAPESSAIPSEPYAAHGEASPGSVPAAFTAQLGGVYSSYFAVQYALSHDAIANARKSAGDLVKSLEKVDMTLLGGEAHMEWMKELEAIRKSGVAISEAGDMVKARTAFITLSELIIQAAKRYGVPGGKPVYRFYCPMANSGKGADWLQNGKEAANPYLGASMPKCGELKETIPAGERKK